jgi:hypothetical protein
VLAGCVVEKASDAEPAGTGGTPAGGAPGTSGEAGAPGAACDGVTESGRCKGSVLEFCDGGSVKQLDCAAAAATCEVSAGRADCVGVEKAESCGSLTELGTCEEAVLQYCHAGTAEADGLATNVPRQINCAAYGQQCDPDGATDGGAICVPHGECPQDITENGTCAQNELRFCENGELYIFDCGVDECRTVDGFADCFVPGLTDGCGEETAGGRCDGDVRVNCQGNVVTRENCATLGLECQSGPSGAACAAGDCPAECPSGYACSNGRCAPSKTPARDWTVAVYIVGDNNLADMGWVDLQEMEAVGSTSAVQVVTEFELGNQAVITPSEYQSGAYRLAVEKDSDESALADSDIIDLGDDVNLSDPEHLAEFTRWAAETYPAKHFALIIWDHGIGYKGGFVDEGSRGEMSLAELVQGVRESGVRPDLLGFDACLMGMHEVAAAFRGLTDVFVGSEDVEPGGGYPYDAILSRLTESPKTTPRELGSILVDEYADYFSEGLRAKSVTQSALDTTRIEPLTEQLNAFAGTLVREMPGNRTALRNAVAADGVLRFKNRESADLVSLLNEFYRVGGDIGGGADQLASWFEDNDVVTRTRATGTNVDAKGLALYTPESAFSWYSTGSFEDYRSATSFLPLQPWQAAVAGLISRESGDVPSELEGFRVVLSWGDEADAKTSEADLDLYVYEPGGDFAVPAVGSVSPNGLLSGDSADTGVPRESYELQSAHASGTYIVLVHYYEGPEDNQVFPRLQVFREDLPGGSRTLLRAKIVDRKLTEFPMSNTKPLETTISSSNFKQVANLEYSNVWYATTIEVE